MHAYLGCVFSIFSQWSGCHIFFFFWTRGEEIHHGRRCQVEATHLMLVAREERVKIRY